MDNLLNSGILQLTAVGKIKDAEGLICRFLRKAKERLISYAPAMRQSQLSQMRAFCYQGGDRLVLQVLAVVKVDLKNVPAVPCKGNDGFISQLRTSVEFELYTLAFFVSLTIGLVLTRFKCLQLFATASSESSEIFLQLVIFSP